MVRVIPLQSPHVFILRELQCCEALQEVFVTALEIISEMIVPSLLPKFT